MCADIFTKTFRELPKWLHAIKLIGIRPSGTLPVAPPEPGPRPETEQKKAENLENMRNGGGQSKTKKKAVQKSAVAVACQHVDDWRQTPAGDTSWLPAASGTKWKGTTAFETDGGDWIEYDHSHKWISIMRTPDHFRRHQKARDARCTGKRRTILFEWKKSDC